MWKQARTNIGLIIVLLLVTVLGLIALLQNDSSSTEKILSVVNTADSLWIPPSLFLDNELEGAERKKVILGEDIIANTARYFGPQGSVAAITNGMNCQNCHLNAGRKNWGNNYSAVFSTYPKFRDRSGAVETIYKRVSDCFERSLNGTAPDSNTKEYQAIYAYIKWIGQNVNKGEKPTGSGIEKLPYLDRAADPTKGKEIYTGKCQSCHGNNGEGQFDLAGVSYIYPPLWGDHSYNNGAGLYRLSNFAGYVKSNMPLNQASHAAPLLTTAEAWDVAAFVNSQPRPAKDQQNDWPNVSKKPVDFPFGPYADEFSEAQHKYGPYAPIAAKKVK
jgi:thiosulfate dehydrogenase